MNVQRNMVSFFMISALCLQTCLGADLPGPELMDRQSLEFLEQFNALNEPPMESLTVHEVRQYIQDMVIPSQISLSKVEDIIITGPGGSIPIRVYIPYGAGPFPVFIFLHGGGWVFGDLYSNDAFCRELSKEANVIVVFVEYRLAPEHKYPSAVHDCYAAAEWVENNIQKWNGSPARVVIGGDSSGGNLSAAVTLMAKQRKFPNFKAQVLIYPVTEYGFSAASYEKYVEGYFLTKNQMRWFWDLYLPDPQKGEEPYASPLKATDLSDLPQALVILAQFDPLFSEGLAYGRRLSAARVPVTLNTYPSFHAFVTLTPQLEIGKKAIEDIAQFLRKSL